MWKFHQYIYKMGRVMQKGPGWHDTWFWVICIWNHLLKMVAVFVFSFKERFLRFQLLFLDFHCFHHVIWRMKWAKTLKTKIEQNMSSGPFTHDAAQIKWTLYGHLGIQILSSRAERITHSFALLNCKRFFILFY